MAAGADLMLVVLSDLLEGSADPARMVTVRRRDEGLGKSAAWVVHKPALEKALAALRPGPAVPKGDTTEQIALNNELHDGAGGALLSHAQGVLQDPGASTEEKEAARWVLQDVITGRRELSLSHTAEIANAERREPIIQAREAALRLIPAPSGRTGLDLANTMTSAAKARKALLAERATTAGTPAAESSAWAKALSELLDFRRTLLKEMESNAELPRDLETLVFGLLDAQRG